ncbi:MAG: plasmid mobilization protein [Rhodomicrobium sp.]
MSAGREAAQRAVEALEEVLAEGEADQPGQANQEKPKRRSESRQRAKRETVRFLDEEHAAIQAKADAAGLSFGAYLRACALGDAGPRAQRSPTIERGLASQAIAELNKAGSNLNQITHAINMKTWPGTPHVTGACDAVKSAALQILRAFGFKSHDSQRQSA